MDRAAEIQGAHDRSAPDRRAVRAQLEDEQALATGGLRHVHAAQAHHTGLRRDHEDVALEINRDQDPTPRARRRDDPGELATFGIGGERSRGRRSAPCLHQHRRPRHPHPCPNDPGMPPLPPSSSPPTSGESSGLPPHAAVNKRPHHAHHATPPPVLLTPSSVRMSPPQATPVAALVPVPPGRRNQANDRQRHDPLPPRHDGRWKDAIACGLLVEPRVRCDRSVRAFLQPIRRAHDFSPKGRPSEAAVADPQR